MPSTGRASKGGRFSGIREFTLGDYSAVSQLWKECGFSVRPGDRLDEIKLKLERDPELFLLAEDKGRIVGSAIGAWDGRRGWIYHLAVKPALQRKGVASSLLDEVERRMKRKGVVKVNALVYDSNLPSLTLFRKRGYDADENLVVVGKLLKD